MELTTQNLIFGCFCLLYVMSKIQILNGTHNWLVVVLLLQFVVCNVKDTNFEWNSQQMVVILISYYVVCNVKDTNFEWNSQQLLVSEPSKIGCM